MNFSQSEEFLNRSQVHHVDKPAYRNCSEPEREFFFGIGGKNQTRLDSYKRTYWPGSGASFGI